MSAEREITFEIVALMADKAARWPIYASDLADIP